MKPLVILTLLFTSSKTIACEVVPNKVMRSLETDEPKSVIARLWDGKDCEEKLFTGLSSGKLEWVKLALALQPHTDAWSSESLQDSLGEAMLKAPSRVLPLIKNYSFNESICMPWMMDDSGDSNIKYRKQIKLARPMFESFLKTSFRAEAETCLGVVAQLEKSYLFSPTHHSSVTPNGAP